MSLTQLRDLYGEISRLARLPLSRLNKDYPPPGQYESIDDYVWQWMHVAHEVATFAVQVGTLDVTDVQRLETDAINTYSNLRASGTVSAPDYGPHPETIITYRVAESIERQVQERYEAWVSALSSLNAESVIAARRQAGLLATVAAAVSTFAVSIRLITPAQARQITIDLQSAHPELNSYRHDSW